MPARFRLTRTITKAEYHWLDDDVPADTIVYSFHGPTYGACNEGVPVTLEKGKGPFFEVDGRLLEETTQTWPNVDIIVIDYSRPEWAGSTASGMYTVTAWKSGGIIEAQAYYIHQTVKGKASQEGSKAHAKREAFKCAFSWAYGAADGCKVRWEFSGRAPSF